MAPYPPKEILIWTIPTLAVLFSVLWYRRKKSSSAGSDTGGTNRSKPEPPVDENTADSGRSSAIKQPHVICAIEKALRDLKTSEPIQEVVSTEEEAAAEEQIAGCSNSNNTFGVETVDPPNHTRQKNNLIDLYKELYATKVVATSYKTKEPRNAKESPRKEISVVELDSESDESLVQLFPSGKPPVNEFTSSDDGSMFDLVGVENFVRRQETDNELVGTQSLNATALQSSKDKKIIRPKSVVDDCEPCETVDIVLNSIEEKPVVCSKEHTDLNYSNASISENQANSKSEDTLFTDLNYSNASISENQANSKSEDTLFMEENSEITVSSESSEITVSSESSEITVSSESTVLQHAVESTSEISINYKKEITVCEEIKEEHPVSSQSGTVDLQNGFEALRKNCVNCEKEDSGEEKEIVEEEVVVIEKETKSVECEGVKEMALECDRVAVEEKKISKIEDAGNHLEEKLASLGLEPSHSPEGGERDSANHSPAEVMLASPSMSTFSDALSEGSLDSGKGCSDVATPPPQTPAGGGSVAGDLVPSVFEFIIPQYLVGRLIGRHGAFLHDIRGKTHTNIFIKRHPDTNKLKVCAIEGTQHDIDAALDMIRHKFPLRRYTALTLERVTFVNVEPLTLYPLQQDQFQLQLVEGVNNDAILSSLISAGHFFLQQPTHPSYLSLNRLNILMNETYNMPEAPALEMPVKDAVCAAPAMGGWYRAQIIQINEDNKTVDVRFLDYGGYLTLENAALRQIRADFMMLPFQAVECLLANVIPAGGDGSGWSEEATLFVQNITCGQILQSQIYDYTEDGVPLVFLYASFGTQVVLVNDELIARGYAEALTPAAAQEE